MATQDLKGVHHVVWCVNIESFPKIRTFWEETVGVAVHEVDLPELGLKVLISWHAGVEVMAPAYPTGLMVEPAKQFLAERGEGVYAVVYGIHHIEDVVAAFTKIGGQPTFRETITRKEVDERRLSLPGERFSILQAGFDDYCGMRIVFQEIVPE